MSCLDMGLCPWTRHVRARRAPPRRGFEAALKNGDLIFAAYCGTQLNTNLLAAGDPLAEAEGEAQQALAFSQKMRFGLVIDCNSAQLGLIRSLRGLTPTFGSFDDEQFNEARIERRFSENPDLAFVEFWYWVRKLQARFFAGDYASAIEASSRAQCLLWSSVSAFETAEYCFYDALSRATCCDSSAAGGGRQQHLDAIAAHHEQLQLWAANCPDNFENRAALVGAEIARIEGRDLDAERLYEEAIRSARANGFVHNEAIPYALASRFYTGGGFDEVAAPFYAGRGFEEFARVYLQKARNCYQRWGADGKVRQLEQLHPHLRDVPVQASSIATIGAPIEQLDVVTVLKAAQAVSGEIVLGDLIKVLLRIAV